MAIRYSWLVMTQKKRVCVCVCINHDFSELNPVIVKCHGRLGCFVAHTFVYDMIYFRYLRIQLHPQRRIEKWSSKTVCIYLIKWCILFQLLRYSNFKSDDKCKKSLLVIKKCNSNLIENLVSLLLEYIFWGYLE